MKYEHRIMRNNGVLNEVTLLIWPEGIIAIGVASN